MNWQLLGTRSPLGHDAPARSSPDGLVGISLYKHQQRSLAALIAQENAGGKRVETRPGAFDDVSDRPVVALSSAQVLSDPIGSGKSVVILALVLANPVPVARAERVPLQSLGP